MTTQKQVIEDKKNILTVHTTAKLHLSDNEYKALDLIAKAYGCTFNDAINTIIHRSVDSELESIIPGNYLIEQLRAEWEQVFDDQERLEQARKDASEIEVTVTLNLTRSKYESFRQMFDAESERYFFSNCVDSQPGEMNGDNPELMAKYLGYQNKRLYGKEEP